jgi:glycerate 2-kinase
MKTAAKLLKIIIAPDKFKGSLTSFEACQSIADGISQLPDKIEIIQFPMADGGDGFAQVFKHYTSSSDIMYKSCDPLGRRMQTIYQWNEKEKTAIIELAVASGLVLLEKNEQNPLYNSTQGTGLQIKDAIERGAEKIILGLGGSATNDAGMGILEALGFHFFDQRNHWLGSCGRNLLFIDKIVPPPVMPPVKFEIACDVQNVLYGPDGAAFVYAWQKGANEEEVKQLDEGLKHFATMVYQQTGRWLSAIPGTGAAGGIAAGLMGFFDVELKEGTKMIIETSGIISEIRDADLLITGEGKIDRQTNNGKVVNEIAMLGEKYDIPVIAYCGINELDENDYKGTKLRSVFAIRDETVDDESSIKKAKELLRDKVKVTLPSIISGLSGNRSL